MSFRDWTRTSESFVLKTAPDVRRTKGGGDSPFRQLATKPVSRSHIPVIERRRMFEDQANITLPERSSSTSSGPGHKRGGKSTSRKDLNRSSSFRASKRMKVDSDNSPVMRTKQFLSGPLPLWQKLRHFGHYDFQSVCIEKLATGCCIPAEHNVKKATGASAAASSDGRSIEDDSNELVASCPAFKTDIGGDHDMIGEREFIGEFKEYLSYDKRKRLCTREKLVFDGEIPLVEPMISEAKNMRLTKEVLYAKSGIHYPFEFIDYGASYYHNYFLHEDHQNFFGIDENIGPVAISLKRERIPDEVVEFYGIMGSAPKYQHRVIVRTSQLATLRGTILELSIPSGAKTDTNKGIPPRDVVEYISQGEFATSCLKLAKSDQKVHHELVRLDEQELNNRYKIGVIYCKRGQSTEEEMYNNEFGSEAFDEFLEILGSKVKMRGFSKYRAQLDNKTDTTGEYSIYTEFKDAEIMFHVSTLLPYTPSNKQQLLRKRHIGNDIVTLIFQDPGCEAFSPRCIRSQFQHIFIVVRVEDPCSSCTKYRVAVTRSHDIPYFGPEIPDNAVFDKNPNFREFILTKLINACNASLRSDKFFAMATRTRKQYLNDLAENYVTAINIEQANTSGRVAGILRNLGHKKRERTRQESTLLYTPGALTWKVSVILRSGKPLPFSEEADTQIPCIMAMGPDLITFVDANISDLLLHIPMRDISGWVQDRTRINLFYDVAYCICLECCDFEEDMLEIITRLQTLASNLTPSHEAILMDFHRNTNGMLGFGIDESGVVRKVDGLAKTTGLQVHSRILQVEDRLVCCHSHSDILEVLTDKNRSLVKAFVIPPSPPPQGERAPLFYPDLNWLSIWSNRPSHGDVGESSKKQNGTEGQVRLRKHRRTVSHTNRSSYMEAMQAGDLTKTQQIDDSEPVYDRLEGSVRKSRSPLGYRKGHEDNAGYLRVRRMPKATRESVVHMAEDLMDRKMGHEWEPEPMEHTIDELSSHMKPLISSSTKIPSARAHTAAPLSLKLHKKTPSQDQWWKGGESGVAGKSDVPLTPGQVSELTKRFSFTPTTPTGNKMSSKIPSVSLANSPMKAIASTSEMTKSNIPIRLDSSKPVSNGVGKDGEVKFRNKQGSKTSRPMSWDASLLLTNQNASVPRPSMDLESQSFSRSSNIRMAFRKKSQSGEQEDDIQAEPDQIHPSANDLSLSEQEPWLLEEAKLSQGSSQNSQGSGSNIPLSVRERTKRWEARGGGVPSYFSTLPKSFRHKANDPRACRREARDSISPSSVQSPTSGRPPLIHRLTVPANIGGHTKTTAPKITRTSTSNIPQPINKASSSSQCFVGTSGTATGILVMSSSDGIILQREEADGSSNPDDHLQKAGYREYGGKMEESSAVSSTKTRNVNITVTKSKTGQSILPTKTLLPASSNIIVSQHTNPQLTEATKGKIAGCVQQIITSNQQDTNFDGVTSDLQKLSLSRDQLSPKSTEMDIKEWIRQTSAVAVAPDTLISGETRDTNSPTLTESSIANSLKSDCSQEAVDRLKQRVDYLESKLEEESENNAELRTKLRKLEKQLHDMQAKKLHKSINSN